MASKSLSKNDEYSELFFDEIFPSFLHEKRVFFDRIHFDYDRQTWVLCEHYLIEDPIQDLNELSPRQLQRYQLLSSFAEYLRQKSGCLVDVYISFYLPKEHNNAYWVGFLQSDYSIMDTNLRHYSSFFRELNFYGELRHSKKPFNGHEYDNKSIHNLRTDNSSCSFSRALLHNDVTYGFNVDTLLFVNNNAYIFEYLLCEEQQRVSPYTSHPNRYFYKNSQKFISLNNLKQALHAPLYLINYAKPGTQYEDCILFMKTLKIEPSNKKVPVLTKNKALTKIDLHNNLSEHFNNLLPTPLL